MKQLTRRRSSVRRADRRRNHTGDPAVTAELMVIAEVRRARSTTA